MRALEMWLGWLTPIKWATVFGSTVLSALAAATILSGSRYVFAAGLCALGSAILSGLDSHFHCDKHQAECRRFIGIFAALEAGFQSVQMQKSSPGDTAEQELEKRFERALAENTVRPYDHFRKRARNEALASGTES